MLTNFKRIANFINKHPLAKRHLFLAYYKFIWWQIRSTFSNELLVVPFIENSSFLAKKGLTGITGNIYSGLHEFEDMSFLLHFLRAEDTFYDIGANVGSYTILASKIRRSKTLAFEPSPITFQFLEQNAKLNEIEDLVRCLKLGVGDKEKTTFFTKHNDTTNHIVLHHENNSIPIDLVTLDKYYPHHIPTLLKIDVEGFELEVLKGASKTLADPSLKAIIIELNGSGINYGISDQQIHNLLIENLFNPYKYNPFTRSLIKIDTFGFFNTIYISDLHFVEKRIKDSPKFKVFGEEI